MKGVTKIRIGAIAATVLVVVALAGIKAMQIGSMIKAGKSFAPPPETVSSAKAEAAQWSASRAAVGTLVALHAVNLSTEIGGRVKEVLFESGTTVKAGAVMVRLDTSMEQAQLDAAQAEVALTKLTLKRTRVLREGGTSTPAELENAEARAASASANAAALSATIAKKTIRAPFDGRVGLRQVEVGQILAAGAPIASLQSVDPIYVEFALPQQALAEVKLGEKVRVTTDVFPSDHWDGELTIINPEVDVASRNVKLRATLTNDGRLSPGMFVSVALLSDETRPVVFVPATSVLFAPYGDSVYVLEPQDGGARDALVARQRFVRLGERRGDAVVITSGLQPGETVVAAGAFKLRNGAAVTVNNAAAPKVELAPKPVDE